MTSYGATTDGQKYWIVKNQWGQNWGLEGYFYLARDSNACGMKSDVAFPTV